MFGSKRYATTFASAMIVVWLGIVSPAAAADSGECVRSGERVIKTLGSALLVARPVHDTPPWQDGSADRVFACSPAYGKRADLGVYGVQLDGENDLHAEVANRNFLAFAESAAGNAGGGSDQWVRVADLRIGKVITKTSPTSLRGTANVEKLLLNPDGWVGWTTREIDAPPGAKRAVQVHENNLKVSRLLASGTRIDREFLRFAADHRTLIWSSDTTGAKVVPKKLPAADDVKSSGRCLRGGDTKVSTDLGSVLIKRTFKEANWKRRYQLIACSRLYHRRVSLGRFGTRTTDPGWPDRIDATSVDLNPRFAAISVKYASIDGNDSRDTVAVFDLASGKLLSREWAAQRPPLGVASSYSVTTLTVNQRGSAAWIVRRAWRDAAGLREHEVHLHDGAGPRVLATGSNIDPLFLRFGDRTDDASLLWSAGTGSGQAK